MPASIIADAKRKAKQLENFAYRKRSKSPEDNSCGEGHEASEKTAATMVNGATVLSPHVCASSSSFAATAPSEVSPGVSLGSLAGASASTTKPRRKRTSKVTEPQLTQVGDGEAAKIPDISFSNAENQPAEKT